LEKYFDHRDLEISEHWTLSSYLGSCLIYCTWLYIILDVISILEQLIETLLEHLENSFPVSTWIICDATFIYLHTMYAWVYRTHSQNFMISISKSMIGGYEVTIRDLSFILTGSI